LKKLVAAAVEKARFRQSFGKSETIDFSSFKVTHFHGTNFNSKRGGKAFYFLFAETWCI
jgi:hypothetical protein